MNPSPTCQSIDLSNPMDVSRSMTDIQFSLGDSFPHLSSIFRLPPSKLQLWFHGEIPKKQHHSRILNLLVASSIFKKYEFIPTPSMLLRSLGGGTFLDLMQQNKEHGALIAQKLVHIVKLGESEQRKLKDILKPTLRH
jgi:hypothetical protein